FKLDLQQIVGKYDLPPVHFYFNTPEDQEYLNLLLEKISLNEKFKKNYHKLNLLSIRCLYLSLTIYAKYRVKSNKNIDQFLDQFDYNNLDKHFNIGAQLLRYSFFERSYPKLLLSTIEHWKDREIEFFEWILSGRHINEFKNIPFKLSKKQIHYLLSSRSFYDGLILAEKTVENVFATSRLLSITSNSRVIKSIINNLPFSHGDTPFEVFDDIARFLSKNFDLLDPNDFWKIINYTVDEKFKNPGFHLKYATANSIKTRVIEWMEEKRLIERLQQFSEFDYILPDENITWAKKTSEDKVINYEGDKYLFELIKDLQRIVEEGRELKHCVANYAIECYRGDIQIYSLQKINQNNNEKLLTIEVRNNTIIQVAGKLNREPYEAELKIIKLWAIGKNFEFII
ncbi:MAG: PcfJ domain-containing protein, partial [Bacteroidales bacterium]|nr:PcfJ domain-containing protein [Bacteroidales bacterium]